MKSFQSLVAVAVVCLLLGTALGYGVSVATYKPPPAPPPKIPEPEPIKIGIELPLTGPSAAIGAKIKEVYDWLAEEANKEGGVWGHKIVLVYADDESKPEKGTQVVERMITVDKVHILAGGFHSSVVLVASEVSNRYGIPWVIGTAIADTITERKYPWVWRTCENSSAYSMNLGQWAAQVLGVSRFATIGEETDFGRLMSEGIPKTILRLKPDAKHVAKVFVPVGETDFYPVFTKIAPFKPQIIFCMVTGVSHLVAIKQFHELGLDKSALLCGEIEHVEDIFKTAGVKAAQRYTFGVSFAYNVSFTPITLKYVDGFMKKYNRIPMVQEVRCIDNMIVILDALRRAGSTDPNKLKRALDETSVVGIRGIVRFDPVYRQVTAPVFVFQIQGETPLCVSPPEQATAKMIYPPEWSA